MRKSKLESERKNRIVRNKTVDRRESSAHTHTRTFSARAKCVEWFFKMVVRIEEEVLKE